MLSPLPWHQIYTELFETVMQNLREAVRQLEEDEHFEQAMLRGTQVVQQQPAISGDLDVIMQSLMMTTPKAPPAFSQTNFDEGDNNTYTDLPKDSILKDDKPVAAMGKRTLRRKEKH